MMRAILLLSVIGCTSRNYTHYLVAPAPKRSERLDEDVRKARPFNFGSTTVMKVRWNDGERVTEVELPLLASGQRIVIEHGDAPDGVSTLPKTSVVPPPPTEADATLIQAYRERGLSVNESAPEVSPIRAKQKLSEALETGNYGLALEWCETVLARYPSHPEFLRAKASVLLLMGEREKAIEFYERAEEVESSPAVRQKLEELRNSE